jgi:hypothetical protein
MSHPVLTHGGAYDSDSDRWFNPQTEQDSDY